MDRILLIEQEDKTIHITHRLYHRECKPIKPFAIFKKKGGKYYDMHPSSDIVFKDIISLKYYSQGLVKEWEDENPQKLEKLLAHLTSWNSTIKLNLEKIYKGEEYK